MIGAIVLAAVTECKVVTVELLATTSLGVLGVKSRPLKAFCVASAGCESWVFMPPLMVQVNNKANSTRYQVLAETAKLARVASSAKVVVLERETSEVVILRTVPKTNFAAAISDAANREAPVVPAPRFVLAVLMFVRSERLLLPTMRVPLATSGSSMALFAVSVDLLPRVWT